jgi:hypothetical protein
LFSPGALSLDRDPLPELRPRLGPDGVDSRLIDDIA